MDVSKLTLVGSGVVSLNLKKGVTRNLDGETVRKALYIAAPPRPVGFGLRNDQAAISLRARLLKHIIPSDVRIHSHDLNTDVRPFSFGGLKENATASLEAAIAALKEKGVNYLVIGGKREPSPDRLEYLGPIGRFLEQLCKEKPAIHNIGKGFEAQG